jgi:hypothetical protein
LIEVLPALRDAAFVMRRSTSAGLMRSDTGEELPGSNGQHGYVPVPDGTDIERFLKTLHERCWLAGFGWMMVGAAGQLLERSIVDRMVGAPERLVFEGPPILKRPLAQDKASRQPIARDGNVFDTIAGCPPLTVVEQQKLDKLKAEASYSLAAEQARARELWVVNQAERLMKRTGLSKDEATRVIECQSRGILLPDVELVFTDPGLAGATVADVLDNPAKFEGRSLADPLEGIDYGSSTAKVMRRSDGTPWINSFAHGRTTYQLKYDLRSARAQIEQAGNPADALEKLMFTANLDEVETKQLLDETAKRAAVGIRGARNSRPRGRGMPTSSRRRWPSAGSPSAKTRGRSSRHLPAMRLGCPRWKPSMR